MKTCLFQSCAVKLCLNKPSPMFFFLGGGSPESVKMLKIWTVSLKEKKTRLNLVINHSN